MSFDVYDIPATTGAAPATKTREPRLYPVPIPESTPGKARKVVAVQIIAERDAYSYAPVRDHLPERTKESRKAKYRNVLGRMKFKVPRVGGVKSWIRSEKPTSKVSILSITYSDGHRDILPGCSEIKARKLIRRIVDKAVRKRTLIAFGFERLKVAA